jgi:hypothetical protein
MFQPENRAEDAEGNLVEVKFVPTTEKRTGERPKDLGVSDPDMLSKAQMPLRIWKSLGWAGVVGTHFGPISEVVDRVRAAAPKSFPGCRP